MQVVLAMFKPKGGRRTFSVTREVTVFGRREDCDLRIPLGDISRRHCRLILDGDAVRIEDMGSSNGTFVNGERVQEAVLAPGDSLQVGPLVFVVQIDGVPAEDAMRPVRRASSRAHAAPSTPVVPPVAHQDEDELHLGVEQDEQFSLAAPEDEVPAEDQAATEEPAEAAAAPADEPAQMADDQDPLGLDRDVLAVEPDELQASPQDAAAASEEADAVDQPEVAADTDDLLAAPSSEIPLESATEEEPSVALPLEDEPVAAAQEHANGNGHSNGNGNGHGNGNGNGAHTIAADAPAEPEEFDPLAALESSPDDSFSNINLELDDDPGQSDSPQSQPRA